MTPLLQTLTGILACHERVVLWFSGGKDSTVLLDQLRPWRGKVAVVSNVVDDGFPGVEEHILSVCQAWGFTNLSITRPAISFDAYVARFGWPMTLVPTKMDGVLPEPHYAQGSPKVASYWHCTIVRTLLPLVQATLEIGADAVLTGARSQDAIAFEEIGSSKNLVPLVGWVRYNPLTDWTDEQIWAYIDEHGIPLPAHAVHKRRSRFAWPECRRCPMSLDYLRWMQEHDGETWAVLRPRLQPVLDALDEAVGDVWVSLDLLGGTGRGQC